MERIDKMKKILLSSWLALFTFSVLLWVKLSDPYMVESTRLKFYDYLMLGSPKQSEQIVTVNIGEKAIAKYGQWPFPREVHAKIIGDIYSRGAVLVGSTILYPEPDRMGTDGVLVDTLRQHPVVLIQTVTGYFLHAYRPTFVVFHNIEERNVSKHLFGLTYFLVAL